MKKYKILLKVFLAIIIISNIPGFTHFFSFFVDNKGHTEDFRFSNTDGGYMNGLDFKGPHFEGIIRLHKEYIDSFPEKKDKKLYRLFWRNPLIFWRWGLYFYDERYALPYKDIDEIKKIRGEAWIKKRFHFSL